MRRLALALPAALLALQCLAPLLLAPPLQALPLQAVQLKALQLQAQVKPSAAIPATPVTHSVSDLPSAHPAVTSAGEANISWNGTQLAIAGGGDSLRNVLRAVSQATGMRVTGGVPEDQVFGNYGPGTVQDVLPQLFDGINVNVMLVNDGATRPRELLLTQRNGAVTPPQTRPIADEDQGFRRRRDPQGANTNGNRPPPPPGGFAPRENPGATSPAGTAPPTPTDGASSTGTPAATAPATGTPATGTPATGTDASGQPESPNGVRTPEQIFEELRKRQQQTTTPQ